MTNALSGMARRPLHPFVTTTIAEYQILATIDLIHRSLFGQVLHCSKQILDLTAVVPLKIVFRDLRRRWVGKRFDADDEEVRLPRMDFPRAAIAEEWERR